MKGFLSVLLLLAAPAWAITVDEVVQLTKAQVSDAVIIGKIHTDGSHFNLSVEDLLRLKKEGVSDAVMKAMIEAGPDANAQGQAPPAVAAGGGPGELVVTNTDDQRGYSIQVDTRGGNLFVYFENMRDREVFKASESRAIPVPPGKYRLRWVGEPQFYRVPVQAGSRTEVRLSGKEDPSGQVVSVDISVDGRRIDGGPLKKVVPAITPTKNPWGGFPSPEEQARINQGQPQTAVWTTTQATYYYPQGYSYYRPSATVVEYHPVHYYYYVDDPGCCYYGGYYAHSLIGPNTLFWTAAGGAIGAANHHVGAGLASGFLFGSLLDNAFVR